MNIRTSLILVLSLFLPVFVMPTVRVHAAVMTSGAIDPCEAVIYGLASWADVNETSMVALGSGGLEMEMRTCAQLPDPSLMGCGAWEWWIDVDRNINTGIGGYPLGVDRQFSIYRNEEGCRQDLPTGMFLRGLASASTPLFSYLLNASSFTLNNDPATGNGVIKADISAGDLAFTPFEIGGGEDFAPVNPNGPFNWVAHTQFSTPSHKVLGSDRAPDFPKIVAHPTPECPDQLSTFDELAQRFGNDEEGLPTGQQLDNYKHGRGGHVDDPIWTPKQKEPGGLMERVNASKNYVLSIGGKFDVISAYRPLTYQAHLWDIKYTAISLFVDLSIHPELATACKTVAQVVSDEMQTHGINGRHFVEVSGVKLMVTSTPLAYPSSQSPHVKQVAVDLHVEGPNPVCTDQNNPPKPNSCAYSMHPTSMCNNSASPSMCFSFDHYWLADQKLKDFGLYRPLIEKDQPHFEIITDPSSPGLQFSANSPIALLVTDPHGHRIGFDPSTNSSINEVGQAAFSGPYSEPQTISIAEGAAVEGVYHVDGIGTGNGTYTVTVDTVGGDGVELDHVEATGVAEIGKAIDQVSYDFSSDYSPPIISAPPYVLKEGSTGATVDFSTSAIDVVDGPVPVACNPQSGTLFPVGDTTITCDATDSHGNLAHTKFQVIIHDFPYFTLRLFETGSQASDNIVVQGQDMLAVAETADPLAKTVTFVWTDPAGHSTSVTKELSSGSAEDHFTPTPPGAWTVQAEFEDGRTEPRIFNVTPAVTNSGRAEPVFFALVAEVIGRYWYIAAIGVAATVTVLLQKRRSRSNQRPASAV